MQVPITDFFGSVRNVELTTNPLNVTISEKEATAVRRQKEVKDDGTVYAYVHPLPVHLEVESP